jgi:hypothetical protein
VWGRSSRLIESKHPVPWVCKSDGKSRLSRRLLLWIAQQRNVAATQYLKAVL